MAKLIPITIPKWGIEMEHGTISEWRVAAGATVAKGDELVDIETDKIVNSFEAAHDGILVRIVAEEGEDLRVGALIGVLASGAVTEEDVDAFVAAHAGGKPEAEADRGEVQPGIGSAERDEFGTDRIRISPALRRKAERLGIDPGEVTGSGYGGRILRDDIEAARESAGSVPLRQLQGAQKAIAERMTFAKQNIPHFYLQRDCRMDAALATLETLREEATSSVTLNHLLVHAVAAALVTHPELNLNVLPDGIRDLGSVDVAIAVDTGDSLLTPVIRGIGDADVSQVAAQADELVARTRNKQLAATDLEGGAITVSNLGMLGVDTFTAIINPPQVMILAVGSVQERVVMNDGQPDAARFCSLTLACDHRVINGAAGARFLAAICEELESLQ